MLTSQTVQTVILPMLLSVPVFVGFIIRKWLQGIKGFVLAFAISSGLMSGTVIVQWLSYDWYLEQQIAPLDRNGDGVWTPDEEATWTEEDRRNMDAYFGDGGRNVFATIIFPLLSAAYSFAIVAIYWLIMAAKQSK